MSWCPQLVLPLFGPLPASRAPATQERTALLQRQPLMSDMLRMQKPSYHLLKQNSVHGLCCCSM